MDKALALEIRELKPGFGAELLGVDLSSANSEIRAQVVRAFDLHGALLVRDQNMSPDALISFLQCFGELEDHVVKQHTLPGYPKIFILSNRTDADGNPIGAHNDGIGRHTDYSFKEKPVKCTTLYALEVPPRGQRYFACGFMRGLFGVTGGAKKRVGRFDSSPQL